jgi:hypothetical protein
MKPQYLNEQGMLIDGNFWLIHPQTGEAWDTASVKDFIDNYQAPDTTPDIALLKANALTEIKQQAADLITALDWKRQRAEDRVSQAELVGGADSEGLELAEAELLEVLNAREAIRVASNDAEAEVLELADAQAVEQFSFAV